MKRRRLAYAAVALLFLLVAADLAYWSWAANRMRDGIRSWIADRAAEGWRIQPASLTVTGWPNVVIARLADVRIAHDPAHQPGSFPLPVRIVSDEVALTVSLFQPTTLTVALHGVQRIDVGDAPPVQVSGDAIEAQMPLVNPTDHAMNFSGRGVRIEPVAKTWAARIGTIEGQAGMADAESSPPAIDFAVSAQAIELPAEFKYPLGRSIRDVSVGGTLNGPFPPGGALPDGALAAAAMAWRDGGGSLEVKDAALDWGPLHLSSTATLALDDQLQPMGSGSAKVTGYDEALDRLAGAGVLTKSAAMVAKAMLSLLAGAGTGDTPSEVDVPLTLQYRTLSMRQVPLVRLPELDWSSP